ncbi:DnaJ-domain-containing protein [Tilletiaria anomala UBC 951]|uniref:DnaJ-domain-containing protein n=1 Tax=Tilletiaria anomala (strain ATCC 24038 / CBS 436.72 / UBC 951) TaxID=1037660 RepID=A0A066WMC9_TILAU|nr:DnaJ-domain-containing protein [Tilletiaria anomala UBC 951]KDN52159.1 DnaJ-domain-containing protein [Tilletiaria anomala UBC 951]
MSGAPPPGPPPGPPPQPPVRPTLTSPPRLPLAASPPPPPSPPTEASLPFLPPPPPPADDRASAVPPPPHSPPPPPPTAHEQARTAGPIAPQDPNTATSIPKGASLPQSASSTVSTAQADESNASALPEDPAEMERFLARERNSFWQELEIERVLAAFKLNPYEIMDVAMEADDKEITKAYRRKSLLIHPDKVKHAGAVEAFDLLKKASTVLLDEAKRKALDETVMEARVLVLRDLSLPADISTEDERIRNQVGQGKFQEMVRARTKDVMIGDELRRRKAVRLQHAAEGAEQRKKEEAATERKRKAEEAERWEETRDERVAGWRSFVKGGKKKKKGDNVLG